MQLHNYDITLYGWDHLDQLRTCKLQEHRLQEKKWEESHCHIATVAVTREQSGCGVGVVWVWCGYGVV